MDREGGQRRGGDGRNPRQQGDRRRGGRGDGGQGAPQQQEAQGPVQQVPQQPVQQVHHVSQSSDRGGGSGSRGGRRDNRGRGADRGDRGGRGRGDGGPREGKDKQLGPTNEGRGEDRRLAVAGKQYETIRLITNMFRASAAAVAKVKSMVCQYESRILEKNSFDEAGEMVPSKKPPKGTISINKDLMREIVLEIANALKLVLVNDGGNIVYSLGSVEDAVNHPSLAEAMAYMTLEKRSNSTVFQVRLADKIYVVQLTRQVWNNTKEQLTQMLQIAVQFSCFAAARMQKQKCYLPVGRIFLNNDVTLFGKRMEDLMLLRGIFESFRFNASNLPMVNIDVAYFPAIRDDISIYDFLSIHAQKRLRTQVEQAMHHPEWVKEMNGYLLDTRAIAVHNNISYTLGGLAVDDKQRVLNGNNAMFSLRDKKKPRMISVLEYTTSIKGIPVSFPDQPVVFQKGRKDIMLLPELLRFKFGESRKLDDDEPSEMIKITRHEPANRFKLIEENAQKIRDLDYWKQFGIDILKKYEVDGKLLPAAQITYSNAPVVPREGSWNLEGKKFFETPANAQIWAVVYPQSLYNQADMLVKNIVPLAQTTGLYLEQEPVWVELKQDTKEAYEKRLREVALGNKKIGVTFYLIILPNKNKPRWRKIKEVCHTELGVVTQCVVLEREMNPKISKVSNKSVLANILAGINGKLKNQNSIILPDLLSGCLGGRKLDGLIVMGLDVFHGDTKDQKINPQPSIVALCASTNENFNKYTVSLSDQISEKNRSQEVVLKLEVMVAEVMTEYLKNRDFPREIIFFRDGVGETMYDLIKTHEITQLMHVMAGLSEIHKKPRPKLTFIIVPKRNHMRTYVPSTLQMRGLLGNPPPGTLIDHPDVIDAGPENFYLYSHKALAGTAKPTHYIVLENENRFSVPELAEFTYGLAHLHQGCTKAVSLPVPVFYADRACGVAGECFRARVDTLDANLKHSPFMI